MVLLLIERRPKHVKLLIIQLTAAFHRSCDILSHSIHIYIHLCIFFDVSECVLNCDIT